MLHGSTNRWHPQITKKSPWERDVRTADDVRTKSLVAGKPGQRPVHQFSDSSIPTWMFPRAEPQLKCDLVLNGCQSVLRTLVLVPLLPVFLFGSAKFVGSDVRVTAVRWKAFRVHGTLYCYSPSPSRRLSPPSSPFATFLSQCHLSHPVPPLCPSSCYLHTLTEPSCSHAVDRSCNL